MATIAPPNPVQDNRAPLRRPVMQYEQVEEKRERISYMTGWMFIVAAFCVDIFEMVLEWLGIGIVGLSSVISIATTVMFGILFGVHHVKFVGKPKNFFKSIGTIGLEVMPGLDAIGGFFWTLGVFALVGSTMEEDSQSNLIVTIYQFTLKKIGL